jgi:hypothetical protein
LFLTALVAVAGSGAEPKVGMQGALGWDSRAIRTTVSLDLKSAGIKMPTGRTEAEDLLATAYLRLIRPVLLSLPLDSSRSIGDLVNAGELPSTLIDTTALSAAKIPPAMSTSLDTLSASYTIDLTILSAFFLQNRRPVEPIRTLTPVSAPAYTGIIVIANQPLPIHGRNSQTLTEPCLLPKIWDSDMNLIYDRTMIAADTAGATRYVSYTGAQGVFGSNPSGLTPEIEAVVGANPLRIIARGIFGILPTDPIIDRADALLIIGSEANRELLKMGKVVFVLDDRVLTRTIAE